MAVTKHFQKSILKPKPLDFLFESPMAPTCALLLKKPWAMKILQGEKTLEIRGSNTKKRGTIAIASEGKVLGEVALKDSFQIAFNDEHGQMHDLEPYNFANMYAQHRVGSSSQIKYKKVYAWALTNPKLYDHPVDLHMKRGCIVWVKLDPKEVPLPMPLAMKTIKKKVIKKPSVA